MAKHYVCTGNCRGVSSVPGACQDEDCDRYHEAMLACDCADGKHKVVLGGDKEFNLDDAEII